MMRTLLAVLTVGVIGFAGLALWSDDAGATHVTMYKSATCGCCANWADYMEARDYNVKTVVPPDLDAIKDRHGVPLDMRSCHIAIVDGYYIEGHVPEAAVARLLVEHPDIDGLAVPGMPQGSPGMSGTATEPLVVYAVAGGEATVYMTF